jgi:hypothetical protein
MPTAAWVPLASVELTETDTSITFTSIPSEYRDLALVYDAEITSGQGQVAMRFNGATAGYDEGAIYNAIVGASGGVTYSGLSSGSEINLGVSNNSMFWGVATILDYSASNKHKMVLTRANNHNEYVVLLGARWPATTTAISSIEVYATASSLYTGSTFYLYGSNRL